MLRKTVPVWMGLLLLVIGSSVSEGAIRRVAKRLNVLEFYGGYSQPFGNYHTIGSIDFVNNIGLLTDIDADRVYDPTVHFGINYGQLRGHWLYSIGFRYTKIETKDTFRGAPLVSLPFPPVKPPSNQYYV